MCDTCADMEYSTQLDTMTSLSSKVLVSALVSCLSALNLQSIVKGMESWRKGLCSWQPYTACVCGCVYVYVNVYIYIHIYMYVYCVCVCVFVCVCVCVCLQFHKDEDEAEVCGSPECRSVWCTQALHLS